MVTLAVAGLLSILPRYLRVLRKGRWVSAEFYRVIAEWNAETQHRCAIEGGLVHAFPLDKGGRIRLARSRSQTRLSRRVVPAEIARDIEKLRVVLGLQQSMPRVERKAAPAILDPLGLPPLPNPAVMAHLLCDDVISPDGEAGALRRYRLKLYLDMVDALEVFVKVAISNSVIAEESDWHGLKLIHLKAKHHVSKLRWAALAYLLHLRPRALGITSSVAALLSLLRLRTPALVIPIRPF
jgi:hypothetical protein